MKKLFPRGATIAVVAVTALFTGSTGIEWTNANMNIDGNAMSGKWRLTDQDTNKSNDAIVKTTRSAQKSPVIWCFIQPATYLRRFRLWNTKNTPFYRGEFRFYAR